jgi:hypothetical protein
MRLFPCVVTCSLVLGFTATLSGADVILKDGQSIATAKPYVVKGKMAILTRTDGSLVSIPVGDIDVDKTAEAANVVPAAPTGEALPAPTKKATTPGEAAKAGAGKKRASISLTDSDVRSSVPYGGADGEKSEKGEGEVAMGPTTETRTKTGYAISGSVVNSGKADISGVAVTIQVVGENNKIIQSTYGSLAKDSLTPGEKATFTAEVATETDAKKFRYVPSHQITIPVKPPESGAAAKGTTASAGAASPKPPPAPAEVNPAPGSLAKAEPVPQPTPEIVARPDVAAPAANASVGAPATPGGAYLPRPSDSQAGGQKNP